MRCGAVCNGLALLTTKEKLLVQSLLLRPGIESEVQDPCCGSSIDSWRKILTQSCPSCDVK